MENMNEFEFEVDLSSCDKLYDFVNCKEHLRPENGWDLSAIRKQSKVVHFDKLSCHSQIRIKCIEKIHTETRLLESNLKKNNIKKESKASASEPDTIETKSFAVGDDMAGLYKKGSIDAFADIATGSNSLPSWVLPIFYPGDRVKGTFHLDIPQAMPAEKLCVEFIGRAEGEDGCDDKRIPYVEEKYIHWVKQGVTCGKKEQLSSKALPSSEMLPAGRHQFPFDFKIPVDAPGSIPPINPSMFYHGEYAFLTYFLKATIDQGKFLKIGSNALFRGIWVENPVDLAKDPDNLTPFTVEESKDTGLLSNSGRIHCEVKMNGKGVLKMGTVPLTVTISNGTDEEIKEVAARIDFKASYSGETVEDRCGSSSITSQGLEKTSGPILPGVSTHQFELTMGYKDGYYDPYLVPDQDTICPFVKSRHEVVIEVRRGALKHNLKMQIPIRVGNKNSKFN